MLRGVASATFAGVALAAAGCGDDRTASSGKPVAEPEVPTETARAAAPKGATVKVVRSQFGRVVADRHGEALYLFDKEKGTRSECYGACAKAWPPLLTKGEPRPGGDARGRLLGTTRRRDGKLQVTYRGHPLYYYEHDEPGRISCQNVSEFGGLWLVVQPDGRAVRG